MRWLIIFSFILGCGGIKPSYTARPSLAPTPIEVPDLPVDTPDSNPEPIPDLPEPIPDLPEPNRDPKQQEPPGFSQSPVVDIIDADCAMSGCHAGAAFLQSEEAFLGSSSIRRIKNGTMPPRLSPRYQEWDDDKRDIILEWFNSNDDSDKGY